RVDTKMDSAKIARTSSENEIIEIPFILDSGATTHMINDLTLLQEIIPVECHVVIADGKSVCVTIAGQLVIATKGEKL
ncbi:hypothetical protein HMI55_003263, partial [Coelomomyces lativittatus]